MRLATDRREQDADLGQPPIERGRLARPARAFDAVPERLRVDRVMEEQRIAEIAELAPRDRVDLGLVPEQAAQRVAVDRRCHDVGPSETDGTVAT